MNNKKILILLLLFGNTMFVFSQNVNIETTVFDTLQVRRQIYDIDTTYYPISYKLDTAVWKIYGDKLKQKLVSFTYVENSNIIQIHYYNNNCQKSKLVMDGESVLLLKKEWFENGQLRIDLDMTKSSHKDTAYYSSGEIHFIATYDFGFMKGHFVEYYTNGKVKEEGEYNFGKVGAWKYYNEKGKLEKEEILNNK